MHDPFAVPENGSVALNDGRILDGDSEVLINN